MILDATDLLYDIQQMELDYTNLDNRESEDAYDYMVDMKMQKKYVKNNLDKILLEIAGAKSWLIMQVYVFMYAKPNMEMHLNRVKPMIETWLENTTYEQLVEAKIITEQDIINNYR
jgi:hypothetical protein